MSIDWQVETSVSPADHVVWLRTYTYAITISVNVYHSVLYQPSSTQEIS
jgi:hypothetical protein